MTNITAVDLDAAVLIAGGGPCGLMLANELGRRGVTAILLDEKPGTSPNPQANATQARTMEYYRRLGLADEIRALGMPADYPTDVAFFTRYAHHELARIALPTARDAREIIRHMKGDWSAAELPHRCSQMFIEPILHKHAARLPSISLLNGIRLVDFADHGDHVAVRALRLADEAPLAFHVGWLVGCDGPRSFVRRALGFNYIGESGAQRDFMGGRMHMLHFRAPQLYDIIPHPKAWMYWSFNRERRSFMCSIDGRGDFVFHTQIKPGEEASQVDDDGARAMLEQCIGAPCKVEVLGRSAWTAGFALVAERFQHGRVLLAGDAAHLFTPSGGLGYNTGIEDAVNLGWKLAAVANGWGGGALVASYERERVPVAKRNTGFARSFAATIGVAPAPEIEEATPAGDAARLQAGIYLSEALRTEFNIPGITFGTRYDGSSIIVGDGTAPPPDKANAYAPTACPGGRAPHIWLPDGKSLFDMLGFEFTLLCLGLRSEGADRFVAAAARLSVPLRVVTIANEEMRDTYEADFVLIRPDQIVVWRGAKLPTAPLTLLQTVIGGAD